MSLEEVEVPHIHHGVETTGDSVEAPNTSSDSGEHPKPRRERKGRVTTAVTSVESRYPAGGSLRVLRVRTATAGVSETKNVTCRARPASLRPGHERAVRSRCKDSPDTRAVKKKSTAMKVAPAASKNTLRPKRSKPVKGKGRSRAAAPAAICKPEAEILDSSCGEDTGVLEESKEGAAYPEPAPGVDPPCSEVQDDLMCQPETKMKKSKQCATLQQETVKKEESGEEEESEVKKEKFTQNKEGQASDPEPSRKRSRPSKDSEVLRQPKRRKKPPVQYVRCEVEGCGTVLAHPRYLQHHIKYQHLLKKKYVCDHPSCGRLFRLQKQLLRHAKHHTDQRDYICEFCARAFKSSHNLAVHRMIHTGEKPIQCEICGFTCRQKASLNWHMKKHDAEASYQFSCSVCGKKFEKKDCVVAHKAKSHPEVLLSEALEANGGTLIKCAAPFRESVSTDTQPEQPSISQDTQDCEDSQDSKEGGTLTPLQQVVLPLTPQTSIDVPQGQFLHLPSHHVVQVAHQQQAPALLHSALITSALPPHLPTSTLPQFVQMPASTVASSTTAQSALATLSSVNTLASQPASHWGREGEEFAHIPGEGELWEKVIVGGEHKDVEVMIWERRKEEEGMVWEREGERQILLQCAESDGDNLL